MLNWNLFDFPPLFWVLTAGLALLALVFVLPPLLRTRSPASLRQRNQVNIDVYRDQLSDLEAEHAQGSLDAEQFQAAKLELENRLAEDALSEADRPIVAKGGRRLGIALGIAIPVLAFGVYFMIGNPWAIREAVQPMAMAGGQHGDFAAMLEKVRRKAEDNPSDGSAWLLLANTYAVMERWQEANQAYAKSVQLLPKDAAALAGYAESIAVLNNRNLSGQPADLLRQALEINPQEPKALELSGVLAYQEGNFAQAAHYWKQLLKQLPPESPYAQDIALALNEAKERAEAAFGKPLDKILGTDKVVVQTINGTVDINPALKKKFPPDAAVFLFAKPLEGGMPIAAIKASARELPLEFELNDSMAMTPQNRLSSHKEVTLSARISLSGEPTAKSGDLEGVITPVKVGAKGIKLVIDSVKP
jgi:cytochrome c-type biogenesis protein CcmH